jgi:phospholipase/carboxylesterase
MIEARRARYGAIHCFVVDGGPTPKAAVVMCHGYGASGMDLAGLSAEWIHRLADRAGHYRFVFPEAPHTLEELGMPDGHAWWPINMALLMQNVQAQRFDQMHSQEPPGIAAATSQICQTIDQVKQELGGDATPLVLGGFSQGAMLTMNAVLRGDIAPPKWLFQFSGTTICQPQWQQNLARLQDTRVYQSHGTIDPLLPYSSAVTLSELLKDGGVELEFHSFVGQHTIDQGAVERTAQLLAELPID